MAQRFIWMAAFTLALTGCWEDESPGEEVGEGMEDVAEEAAEETGLKESAPLDDMGEAIEEAGE